MFRPLTRCAVDALSITPPGGATDSIRWAMPTCSPMVVYPSRPVPISPAITGMAAATGATWASQQAVVLQGLKL